MSYRDNTCNDNSNDSPTITPRLAVLLIEEGIAIKTIGSGSASDIIYQRNRKLDFFSFRKWRKTEDYAIQNEMRDKIYCFKEHSYNVEPEIITQSEFLKNVENCTEIVTTPPLGFKYTDRQIKSICIESKKLVKTIQQFI